jgi:hypothetical protein
MTYVLAIINAIDSVKARLPEPPKNDPEIQA